MFLVPRNSPPDKFLPFYIFLPSRLVDISLGKKLGRC